MYKVILEPSAQQDLKKLAKNINARVIVALEKIEVVKNGTSGSRRAKLYYTREKHKREVDEIYARAAKRVRVAGEQKAIKAKVTKKISIKKGK